MIPAATKANKENRTDCLLEPCLGSHILGDKHRSRCNTGDRTIDNEDDHAAAGHGRDPAASEKPTDNNHIRHAVQGLIKDDSKKGRLKTNTAASHAPGRSCPNFILFAPLPVYVLICSPNPFNSTIKGVDKVVFGC